MQTVAEGRVQVVRNLHSMGRELDFLRWLYKRSQTYFGQKPEEHGFSIKKHRLEAKATIFEKKMLCKKIGDPKLSFW